MLSHSKFQEHFKNPKENKTALTKDTTKDTSNENFVPETNETEVIPGITRELEKDKEITPSEP